MREKPGSFGGQPILHRDNVHCLEAFGDVDVVPIVAYLDFVESGMVSVRGRWHTAVKSGCNFRQIVPCDLVDRNNRPICPQPRANRNCGCCVHILHDLIRRCCAKCFNLFSDATPRFTVLKTRE